MNFDLTLVRSMSGGDERFVLELLEIFTRQYGEIKEGMMQALATDNPGEIGRLAHKLKASIDTLSINHLKQLIREIEEGGKAGEDMSALCEQLFLEMEVVIAEMSTLMK